MISRKLKFLLLEDYGKIKTIYNFLLQKGDNYLTTTKAKNLIDVYEKLFFKYGLMDASFLVYKRDLEKVNPVYISLLSVDMQIDNIKIQLFKTIKKCLSDIEQKYLVKDVKN